MKKSLLPSLCHRRKNCLLVTLLVLTILVVVHQLNEGTQRGGAGGNWGEPRPLGDAVSEARRLLALLNGPALECNVTLSGAGNSSVWPVCMLATGITGTGRGTAGTRRRVAYSIGMRPDYFLEASLAFNHSYAVHLVFPADPLISPALTRWLARWPNTTVEQAVIVANDPADYARNAYDQRTVNSLWGVEGGDAAPLPSLKGGGIAVDLLRLLGVGDGVEMWEVLHYLLRDGLMERVRVLQLELYIDKVDEDLLYHWYRTLHALFIRAHFALYHTASGDARCLHVTLMQSCAYQLSFIRVADPLRGVEGTPFLLYPPNEFGMVEDEARRLLDYARFPQAECSLRRIGGASSVMTGADEMSPRQPPPRLHERIGRERGFDALPVWRICANRMSRPCSVVRFRAVLDSLLERQLVSEGCSVITVLLDAPIGDQSTFRLYRWRPDESEDQPALSADTAAMLQSVRAAAPVSLLEVDLPGGEEWSVLRLLMDHQVLTNVTQLVASVNCYGYGSRHHFSSADQLLVHYSTLRRIESFGLSLFHSAPSHIARHNPRQHHSTTMTMEDLNLSLGYVRTRYL